MMMTKIRCYSELIMINGYHDRLEYLKIIGLSIAEPTFGHDRYLNQMFYQTKEWKTVRNKVIIRDNGCDLGISDYPIYGPIYIHHMNPVTKENLVNRGPYLLDPEYLICVSYDTHNAIHYGTDPIADLQLTVRTPNDTCPWKKAR